MIDLRISVLTITCVSLVPSQSVAQIDLNKHLYAEAHLQRFGSDTALRLSGWRGRLDLLQTLGFGGVRLDIEWNAIEGVRGRWSWDKTDGIVQELRRRGIQAFGLLTYAPMWAVPRGMPERHRPFVDGSEERGDTAFAHFAAMVVRRYGDVIHRWEIWNEENNPPFWINVAAGPNAGPDAKDYLRLFNLARDSIAAVSADAEIAIGGLASLSGRFQSVPDPAGATTAIRGTPGHVYLRELLAAGWRPGIVALHPYSGLAPGQRRPGESSAVFPDQVFDSVLDVLNSAGFPDTPVWITEWGVNIKNPKSQPAIDEWFVSGLHTLLCNPRVPFVTIYALTDSSATSVYGLAGMDGTLSAGGRAFRNAVSAWRGCGT